MIRPVECEHTCKIDDECVHTTARLNFHNGFECEHIGTASAEDERCGRHRLDSRYHCVVFLPGLVVSKVESLLYRVVLSLFWKISKPSQIARVDDALRAVDALVPNTSTKQLLQDDMIVSSEI